MRRNGSIVVAVSLLLTATDLSAASFTTIDLLPGGNYVLGSSISGDGSAVTGYGNSSSAATEPFRWTSAEGTQGLGRLPGMPNVYGLSISADGSAVAGYGETATRGTQAIRWHAGSGIQTLGFLAGGGHSQANGISADGSVVVGYGNSSAQPLGEAFRWTETGGMRGLGSVPGGTFSLAEAVSGDGAVVVGRLGSEAFRWTEGEGMAGLGFLPQGGYRSDAIAASYDGSVIVGWGATRSDPSSPTISQPFRWTASGGMEGLGLLPEGSGAQANGVSGDGSIVVGLSTGGGDQAFFWTREGGMQRLLDVLLAGGATGLIGWQLTNAIAISQDGTTVLAAGFDPQQHSHVVVASLVPIPAVAYLLPTIFAAVGWATRRRVFAGGRAMSRLFARPPDLRSALSC